MAVLVAAARLRLHPVEVGLGLGWQLALSERPRAVPVLSPTAVRVPLPRLLVVCSRVEEVAAEAITPPRDPARCQWMAPRVAVLEAPTILLLTERLGLTSTGPQERLVAQGLALVRLPEEQAVQEPLPPRLRRAIPELVVAVAPTWLAALVALAELAL